MRPQGLLVVSSPRVLKQLQGAAQRLPRVCKGFQGLPTPAQVWASVQGFGIPCIAGPTPGETVVPNRFLDNFGPPAEADRESYRNVGSAMTHLQVVMIGWMWVTASGRCSLHGCDQHFVARARCPSWAELRRSVLMPSSSPPGCIRAAPLLDARTAAIERVRSTVQVLAKKLHDLKAPPRPPPQLA